MSELPLSWERTVLGEVITIRNGYAFKSKDFCKEGVPVVRQSNLTGDLVDLSDCVHVPATIANQASNFRVSRGDVLLGMSGSIGEPSVYCYDFDAVQNQRTGLVRFFVDDLGHRNFVKLALILFERKYISQGKGIGVQNVSASDIEKTEIPLPPLSEQRRIVAKIDSLSAKSRRSRDHLDPIPRLVEKYKQAILAAAFRGELTREWRRINGIDDEWDKASIGDVAIIASGQTPKGIEQVLDAAGELPWFKVSSMNEPENLRGLCSSQFRLSRREGKRLGLRVVPEGSITFPKRGGAIATNKKRRLLVDGALDLNLMVLTAKNVTGDFLWWWMQKLDLASISNGSNVPQINYGDIAPLEIGLPTKGEQEEISRRIEAAFAWIDRLASEATSARKLIDHLDQAVLAKAFRGELVPQDPNDEPASVLLERIRAERKLTPKRIGKRSKTYRPQTNAR